MTDEVEQAALRMVSQVATIRRDAGDGPCPFCGEKRRAFHAKDCPTIAVLKAITDRQRASPAEGVAPSLEKELAKRVRGTTRWLIDVEPTEWLHESLDAQELLRDLSAQLAAAAAREAQLAADLATLNKEVSDALDGQFPDTRPCIARAVQQQREGLDRATARAEAAEQKLAALRSYVQHTFECNSRPVTLEGPGCSVTAAGKCTCGLAAILDPPAKETV